MTDLIAQYVYFVKTYQLPSSAVQVAVLGTLGELLASKIRGRGWMPFNAAQLAEKVLVWALLGVSFKVAFVGFFGFFDAVTAKGFWPQVGGVLIWRAFSVSLFTNALFGPVMMAFHRATDNFIERKPMNWATLVPAWWTLAWFWVPAHTVTFSLPAHLQVGLAAVWAVVLGVILGYFARQKTA